MIRVRGMVSIGLLLLMTCSCQSPEPSTLSEPTAGERIISLMPSGTEFVYALGVQAQLVGRSTHCDHPADVTDIPSVGTGLNPDLEAMLALRPTLILASGAQENVEALIAIRDAGVEVLVLPDGSLDDALEAPVILGRRFDLTARGEALRARMQSELDSVAAVRDPGNSRALVFVGHNPFFVAGRDTFVGELLAHSGVENLAPLGWSGVDAEFILVAAPEVVIDLAGADPGVWTGLEGVPAVRDGRVCAVDPNLISRPGPRIGQAAQAVRRCFRDDVGSQAEVSE